MPARLAITAYARKLITILNPVARDGKRHAKSTE
jgi:hypothetical protein